MEKTSAKKGFGLQIKSAKQQQQPKKRKNAERHRTKGCAYRHSEQVSEMFTFICKYGPMHIGTIYANICIIYVYTKCISMSKWAT